MEGGNQLAIKSVAEDLNSRQLRTNPACGQSGTQTWDCWIVSLTHWPPGHADTMNYDAMLNG